MAHGASVGRHSMNKQRVDASRRRCSLMIVGSYSLQGDELPHQSLKVESSAKNVPQIGGDICPSHVFQHLFHNLVGVLGDRAFNVCHNFGNLHLEWIICIFCIGS